MFQQKKPRDEYSQYSVINAAATLTAAQAIGGFVNSVPVAGINITTPTASGIFSAMNFPVVNSGFDLYIRNISAGANTITLVGGSDVTISGTATTAQNTISVFRAVFASTYPPKLVMFRVSNTAV